MYINCLHGALPFYWVSLYNHMICKCAGVTGYEHEEFIVKLPGIMNTTNSDMEYSLLQ